MEKKKIEIIVNNQNMIDSFIEGLKTNSIFTTPKEENMPDGISKRMSLCRAYYELENFDLIIRCLEDIMPPFFKDVMQSSEKNSNLQYKLLSGYLKNDAPDLVISSSVAGSTPKTEEKANGGTVNGCVYIGAEYFMFDGKEYDKTSVSSLKPYVYLASTIDNKIFEIFSEEEKKQLASHFIAPPNKPANPLTLNLSKGYVCNSLVNVMDNSVFDIVDSLAQKKAFDIFGDEKEIVSFDTIHGVSNMAAIKAGEELDKEIDTLFISAIEDRFCHHNDDVDNEKIQGKTAIYNSGVASAALLEKINANISILD